MMKIDKLKFNIFLLAHTFLLFGFLSSLIKIKAQTPLPPPKSYQFINGNWFDGESFRRRSFYSVNGILTNKKPRKIDETVDLKSGYVIPPFAEGHNHWVEPQRINDYIRNYLRDGVFYVKDEANFPYIVSQFRDKVNRPTSVDCVTALQGFTGSNGHPLEIVRQLQAIAILPEEWTERDFDGKAVRLPTTQKTFRAV